MVKQLLLLAFITVAWEAMGQDAQCVPERAAMVETIQAYARIEASVLGPRGVSERILDAMGQTDRHRFVPGRSCSVAYMDGPVLIGQGQTISQPFIVALMTDLAAAAASFSTSARRYSCTTPSVSPRPSRHFVSNLLNFDLPHKPAHRCLSRQPLFRHRGFHVALVDLDFR
jgi:hypothetical protein